MTASATPDVGANVAGHCPDEHSCCCECRDHLIAALACCMRECEMHEAAGRLTGAADVGAVNWPELLNKLKPAARAVILALLEAFLSSER